LVFITDGDPAFHVIVDPDSRIPVFRIRNILVQIWIHGSVPLTNGSGSCSFRQYGNPQDTNKKLFFPQFFAYYFLKVYLHHLQIKSHKEVRKQ
jgi:hypothetical protein